MTLSALFNSTNDVGHFGPFKPVAQFIRQHPLKLRQFRAVLFSVSPSLLDIEHESLSPGESFLKENGAYSAASNGPCPCPISLMRVPIFKPNAQAEKQQNSSYAPHGERRMRRSSSPDTPKRGEGPQQFRPSPSSENSGILKPLPRRSRIIKRDPVEGSVFRRFRGIREFSGTSQNIDANCITVCSSARTVDSPQQPIVGSKDDSRAPSLDHVSHDSAVIQLVPELSSPSVSRQEQRSTPPALPRSTNLLVHDKGINSDLDLSSTTAPASAATQTSVPVITREGKPFWVLICYVRSVLGLYAQEAYDTSQRLPTIENADPDPVDRMF